MEAEKDQVEYASPGSHAAKGKHVATIDSNDATVDLAASLLNVIESMDIAMTRIDTDFRVLAFNQKAREIYGDIPLGDFCYHMAADLREVCANCPAKAVFDGQATGRSEHRRMTAAGREIYIDHIATPIKNADGNTTGALLLIIDITKSKQQQKELLAHRQHLEDLIKARENALRKSEERLDLALDGANEGIWDWYLESNRLHFDTRYYTMAGYAPDEFPAAFEE